MLKKILRILKKIIVSVFLLYAVSLILNPLDIVLPINLLTISFVTVLGIPAILSLILIFVIVF